MTSLKERLRSAGSRSGIRWRSIFIRWAGVSFWSGVLFGLASAMDIHPLPKTVVVSPFQGLNNKLEHALELAAVFGPLEASFSNGL